jgi:geranylgeranyl reductase
VSAESVDCVVLGAGPAGLRAAQVLAESGREVVVLEKKAAIGPKTCAGGLTAKSVAELVPLGLPLEATFASVGHVRFGGEPCTALDAELALVRTISRAALGRMQAEWASAAGAEIRSGTPVHGVDIDRHEVSTERGTIRYRHLIGADGSDSAVRRALHLRSPRACVAAEFNVPGVRLAPLRIECDEPALANGYFWVFPHADYTSVGAAVPKDMIPPRHLRPYIARRAEALGTAVNGVPFEAATLEVEYCGLHFPGGVHLAGDAAGAASSLTAEGIYAALVTGEEVARGIVEPAYPAPKTRRWLTVKARHDRLMRRLRARWARALTIGALSALVRVPPARRPLARWFVDG